MGFLENMLGGSRPEERIQLVMQNQALQEELRSVHGEVRELQEDMLKISDAFDNVGWSPLDADEAAEIPLKTVKKIASVGRAVMSLNPFVKRGVEARLSYIWGKGVTFDGVSGIAEQMELNRKKLFTPQAYEELERVLATDGNAFMALPVEGKAEITDTVFRLTIDKVTDAVSNPRDREEIWYYKIENKIIKTNADTGQVTEEVETKYYASLPYYQKLVKQGKNLPRRWGKFGVEQKFVIQHTTVNKQVGWRWGLPDVAPVLFWAKAYKEYLEDNALLVKAYSRLAWQVKASTTNGAGAAAAQVMAPPSRDPITGQLRDIGGTAVTGLGTELSPTAATGSTVDFDKGSALAAAIASGLQVSKVIITSDPGSGNRATAETLDQPTLKAMESRQQLHTERFLEIFEYWGADVTPNAPGSARVRDAEEAVGAGGGATDADHAIVTWPQIESDSTKDRITALGTGVELGILYKQEARKEAINVFGIAPYKPWDDLPTMEDDPAAKERFDNEQQAQQEASVIASQGNSGGISARGGTQTGNNEARNNRDSDSNNS